MVKIMIIEDDDVISSSLRQHLLKWNFDVYVATDFEHIIEQFITQDPALVLLDISLPFYNGYYWCQEMRKISHVPIVFISSTNENMNIVMAMNMGADDFINKPFDLNVLTAKIQAIMRRSYSTNNTIEKDGKVIELTKNELKILQLLIEKAETYVSREEMMMELWQTDQFVDDNTLSVNMNRLRKKLDELNIMGLIQTKKGIGYKLSYEDIV